MTVAYISTSHKEAGTWEEMNKNDFDFELPENYLNPLEQRDAS